MNGIHDLGGMDGLGPIVRETNEPVFHSDWERQVAGLFFLTILKDFYNDDEFRQAREKLQPVKYLEYPYYQHWLLAIQQLLIEKQFLTDDEIKKRMSLLSEEQHE
jgi:nitrile hydratase subunit beta